MPYRDPAQRAAWMREYRKRKRVERVGEPASLPSRPSNVRAPEPSRVSQQGVMGSSPQPSAQKSGPVRNTVRSSFKTALRLAQTFPFGVRASHVCPYCCSTGHSSPGTRCSYCRSRDRWEPAPFFFADFALLGEPSFLHFIDLPYLCS